jgi:hypothetical protein
MAQADQSSIDKSLPPEGLTLGEIVERMISREAWDFITVMLGDRPNGHPRQLAYFKITPEALTYLEPDSLGADATRACLPILDWWNSGAWIAKGRRGSPIEPAVEIPPPATGYQLIVKSLARSTMIEPGSDRKKLIYDLRFYSPITQTPDPTKTTASSSDPAPAAAAPSALSDDPDPFRTGEPGRPNYSEYVLEEAKYRIRTGQVVPARRGKAKFALGLWGWWESVRPGLNAPAFKTSAHIENIVRDIWNDALSANPRKLPAKK